MFFRKKKVKEKTVKFSNGYISTSLGGTISGDVPFLEVKKASKQGLISKEVMDLYMIHQALRGRETPRNYQAAATAMKTSLSNASWEFTDVSSMELTRLFKLKSLLSI